MARKPLIEPGSILPTETMLSRIVARDREKAGRAETEPTLQSSSELSESNMTGHITDKLTDKQDSHKSNHQDDNMAGSMESKQTRKLTDILAEVHPAEIDGSPAPKGAARGRAVKRAGRLAAFPETNAVPESGSLAESIRASLRAPAADPALKTVTLKMSPALDRKIEDHCYQTGRKKQDVIRDAVLLYFEAVESSED